ncbi:MAG: 4Fe-4S binding protein [Deltaproteobacteria bacterium]|nr:4Fe-4S binding protein [Deltaproteobacteria bacterium]
MAIIRIQVESCLRITSHCSLCIDECPMQLLDPGYFEGTAEFVIEDTNCIECRNCEVTCPTKAIEAVSAEER